MAQEKGLIFDKLGLCIKWKLDDQHGIKKTKGSRCHTYDLVDNQSVSLESIIALANLSYGPISKKYQLDANDYKIFNDYVRDTYGNLNRIK